MIFPYVQLITFFYSIIIIQGLGRKVINTVYYSVNRKFDLKMKIVLNKFLFGGALVFM